MTDERRSQIAAALSSALADGQALYEIVETYAEFGDHHTGTEADHQTTDWLAGILEQLGADVTLPRFDFERYICRAALRCGDRTVPTVPVFYSGYGHWQTSSVDVMEVDVSVAGNPTSLDSVTATPAGSRALAIAINGPDDQPVQCNRVPVNHGVTPGPGRPAVIIPGNWADRVRDGARLSFDGSLESAESRNVVATLGSPDDRRVTITTPLTGWTPCAGERGTGLAVALAMAADLARDHHVVLVGGSGHELDHYGLRAYLSTQNVTSQPVIHLGASVGAVESDPQGQAVLGSRRRVMTNAPESIKAGIAERASEANWEPMYPEEWPGEGATWREAGANVLSFLGSFEHFHLATDLPGAATNPAAMEQASRAAIATARYFLSASQA